MSLKDILNLEYTHVDLNDVDTTSELYTGRGYRERTTKRVVFALPARELTSDGTDSDCANDFPARERSQLDRNRGSSSRASSFTTIGSSFAELEKILNAPFLNNGTHETTIPATSLLAFLNDELDTTYPIQEDVQQPINVCEQAGASDGGDQVDVVRDVNTDNGSSKKRAKQIVVKKEPFDRDEAQSDESDGFEKEDLEEEKKVPTPVKPSTKKHDATVSKRVAQTQPSQLPPAQRQTTLSKVTQRKRPVAVATHTTPKSPLAKKVSTAPITEESEYTI